MKRLSLLLSCLLLLCGCATSPTEPYSLSAQQIESDTRYLTETFDVRPIGSEAEYNASLWLEETLSAIGYEGNQLERTIFTDLIGTESQNITAIYNPDDTLPLIVVVAHYDSIPTSVGAGDNAVAVAIMLEMARYLQTSPEAPNCQIELVFLGGEETGYHGSRNYVELLSQADRDRLLGTYNMDISAALKGSDSQLVCTTLGGNQDGTYLEGNFFEPVANVVSLSIQEAYLQLYDTSYGGLFHTGESDHISFHNAELDAANVCWRGVGHIIPTLPSTYHQPEDVWDTLDYDTAVITGRCVLRAIDILLESI